MAGYSGTPLPKKLGIKPFHVVSLIDAPDTLAKTLGVLPDGVETRTSLRGSQPIDVVLLFATRLSVLRRRFPGARSRIAKNGGLWVCWPKKSSGLKTDLSDGDVRQFGLESGLVDNEVCAVDETWSALRFVWRVEDR